MNNKVKGLIIILWNFFIVLSVVTFLVSLLHIVRENVTDTWSLLFSACGCCLLIVMIVWNRFSDILKRGNVTE